MEMLFNFCTRVLNGNTFKELAMYVFRKIENTDKIIATPNIKCNRLIQFFAL